MQFTVANHNKTKDASQYISYEVEFEDIKEIAISGFNYCACRLKNEYRLDTNFDGGVDVLILDIDDGCCIEQARVIFSKYENFIITSKSHQKDKGGLICDRYRVFLKLDKTINIKEHIEQLYINAINLYPFVDAKCKNVSRFFYSSPTDAKVYYNKGKEYLTKIILWGQKSTNEVLNIPQHTSNEIYRFNELLEVWITDSGQVLENEVRSNEENNIKGVIKFLDMEFYQGNKSHALFNASCIMRKDGFTDDFIIDFLLKEWEKRSCSSDKFKDALLNIKGGLKY